MKFLEKDLVAFNISADSPSAAIEEAGNLLVKKECVEARYVDAMVTSFETYGPYFVIAPHIAMPHAKPEDGVLESSISLVTLKTPIVFGKEGNDPVKLVFAIASQSTEEHLKNIQTIVKLLSNKSYVDQLMEIKEYDILENILEEII